MANMVFVLSVCFFQNLSCFRIFSSLQTTKKKVRLFAPKTFFVFEKAATALKEQQSIRQNTQSDVRKVCVQIRLTESQNLSAALAACSSSASNRFYVFHFFFFKCWDVCTKAMHCFF